jgi:hypothetical protein
VSRQTDALEHDTDLGLDPTWGTLGALTPDGENDWLAGGEELAAGHAVDVEIFGDGFYVSGLIGTGRFDRLSDWINVQTGFVQVREAWQGQTGRSEGADWGLRHRTLWVRLDQIVLVAERSPIQRDRPGMPAVPKERRKVSIVTPAYELLGSIHVHTYGSMSKLLESPEPHFLPMTVLTVRSLADAATVARFPFALVNREQIVSVLQEPPIAAAEGPEPIERPLDALLR